MSEAMALRGRLSHAKDNERKLEAEAVVLIRAARAALDLYLKPVTKLKIDEAVAAVSQLKQKLTELSEVQKLIAELEEDLGQ